MEGGHSRRTFIKGVIAAGATVSASAYLFRTTILGQKTRRCRVRSSG